MNYQTVTVLQLSPPPKKKNSSLYFSSKFLCTKTSCIFPELTKIYLHVSIYILLFLFNYQSKRQSTLLLCHDFQAHQPDALRMGIFGLNFLGATIILLNHNCFRWYYKNEKQMSSIDLKNSAIPIYYITKSIKFMQHNMEIRKHS